MARPTISLALIAKNEEKNVSRLLESVKDCFDEVVFVDTGSTDKTVELAFEHGCKVFHFEWVNDFSKARNFAFSKVTSDYVCWLDLDDVLHNRENFIQWRDHAMGYVDFWFAAYHYALDKDGKPIVSFARERVFKKSINPTWQYALHEGIIMKPEWSKNYATTWAVNHMRDAEDVKADKSRNIKILEEMQEYDSRMRFYLGKELYEAGRPFEALPVLEKASALENIEHHDRMLAYQYASYAAMACATQIKDYMRDEKLGYFKRAFDNAHKGIALDPHRAEFHCSAGDALIQMGNLHASVPYFSAAKACHNPKASGSPYEGAVYSFANCYGEMPSLQLAKVYFHLGLIEKAQEEASFCYEKYENPEAKEILEKLNEVKNLITLDNNQKEVPDIVFSCPPQNAMEFDEKLYQEKGCGGSETALIEMARNLKAITGRPVKVFNPRKEDFVAESGVEYISNTKLNKYLSENKPHTHIAWRHNIKVTNAPTYLWCHDLFTSTVESVHNFDKIMCLTPFHKNYVKGLQGVPDEKIVVTRNGINPEKFKFERKPKDPNKIVWMSSPDRGLDRCMQVMDVVRKEFPDIELHVYYGIEGLYKYGPHMSALADKLKGMMAERPYVKYHGFTEQKKMYQEVSDAVIWLHPCNFIETSCITAMEMLALGVFPVTRRLGGLMDTLKEAEQKRQAILLDNESSDVHAFSEKDLKMYADATCRALLNRQWENIDFDLEKHSWASVAREWADFMALYPRMGLENAS